MPVEIVESPSLPLESVESVLGLLASFGIVVVLTFFMLIRRENLRNRLISLAGQRRLHVMTQAMDEATERVSRYLRLQLLVNICYGALIGTCLHFIGIPGALLWGVVVGLLRFLPYIGPPLGGVMPLLLSLAIFNDWIRPLEVFGLFVITELLVSNIVEPFLYGAYTGLSSMAILLAAIFWTALWGPIGLVLSTPLTVCVVVIGRHVPRLGFLTVLLGDEPVLTPDTRYYQRLLAMDHEEAKRVLETYLKDKPLEDLYDSVLMPALNLSERDRHRNRLEDSTSRFITRNTRRIVAELFEERQAKTPQPPVIAEGANLESLGSGPERTQQSPTTLKIVSVPARDEADETISAMLCQLLDLAGRPSECIPLGRISDMVSQTVQAAPDVVCISALPPFAFSHAKSTYSQLRAQLPETRIFIGIWNYPGDLDRLAHRLGITDNDRVATTLKQAVSEITGHPSPARPDSSPEPAYAESTSHA